MVEVEDTPKDANDGMPRDSYRITWRDLCRIFFAGFLILVDFGFDIYLANKFYRCYNKYIHNHQHPENHHHEKHPDANVSCTPDDADDAYLYFILTLVFLIVPSVIMSAQSLIGYKRDVQNDIQPQISISHWITISIFHLFQLAPIWRCAETLILGNRLTEEAKRNALSKSDQDALKKHYHRAYYRLSSLKLLEAFLEGCPQLVLQTYILIKRHDHMHVTVLTCIKIGISLLSVAISMMNYHEKKRWDEPHRRVLHGPGIALQFLWYLFTLLSRLIALAVLALLNVKAYVIVVSIHWILMFLWIQYDKHKSNVEDAILHNIGIGGIYIFNFVKDLNQPMKWHYVIYYFIVFVEGLTTMVVWYEPHNTECITIISIFFGSFALGIISMIYHYRRHPSVMHAINPLHIVLQVEPNSFPDSEKTANELIIVTSC